VAHTAGFAALIIIIIFGTTGFGIGKEVLVGKSKHAEATARR
jgi:hypothetical protein